MNLTLEAADGTMSYPIRKLTIDGEPPHNGVLEVPEMWSQPSSFDFVIMPFEIPIRLTQFEPRHPHFVVTR